MKIEKKVKDELRQKYYSKLTEFFGTDFEIYQTAAGTFYIEDESGAWLKFSVIVPEADEMDGTDGASLAEEYSMKQEEKAEKAAAKAVKAAKDAEKRAAKKQTKSKSNLEIV